MSEQTFILLSPEDVAALAGVRTLSPRRLTDGRFILGVDDLADPPPPWPPLSAEHRELLASLPTKTRQELLDAGLLPDPESGGK